MFDSQGASCVVDHVAGVSNDNVVMTARATAVIDKQKLGSRLIIAIA